jgi:hypothetical protein
MDFTKVKIVTFVPFSDANKLRKALGDAGAGKIGEYSYCSYSVTGVGRFTPSINAHPHIGSTTKPEEVEEERIEVVCDRSNAKRVIAAMRQAHPYEEVAFDIYPLVDEASL